jgi:hypothetical protein
MENRISTILENEGDIPPGYIDDYIRQIKTHNIFDKYTDMTDEEIVSDWSCWMDNTWQFKDTWGVTTPSSDLNNEK